MPSVAGVPSCTLCECTSPSTVTPGIERLTPIQNTGQGHYETTPRKNGLSSMCSTSECMADIIQSALHALDCKSGRLPLQPLIFY